METQKKPFFISVRYLIVLGLILVGVIWLIVSQYYFIKFQANAMAFEEFKTVIQKELPKDSSLDAVKKFFENQNLNIGTLKTEGETPLLLDRFGFKVLSDETSYMLKVFMNKKGKLTQIRFFMKTITSEAPQGIWEEVL